MQCLLLRRLCKISSIIIPVLITLPALCTKPNTVKPVLFTFKSSSHLILWMNKWIELRGKQGHHILFRHFPRVVKVARSARTFIRNRLRTSLMIAWAARETLDALEYDAVTIIAVRRREKGLSYLMTETMLTSVPA